MNFYLQIGSILFVIGGLFDALIGAATPIVTRATRPNIFMLSAQSDLALFGRNAGDLLHESTSLALLYRLTFDLIGTLLSFLGSWWQHSLGSGFAMASGGRCGLWLGSS